MNGTDAVNLNQLDAAAGAALGQAQRFTDARVNGLPAPTQQVIGQSRSYAAATRPTTATSASAAP